MNTIAEKKHYFLKVAKGWQSFMYHKVVGIMELDNETLFMSVYINVSKDYILREMVEAEVTYNLKNGKVKIKPVGKGSREYNRRVKMDASYIMENLINVEAVNEYKGDMAEVKYMTAMHYYKILKDAGATVPQTNEMNYKFGHELETLQEKHEYAMNVLKGLQIDKTYTLFNRSFKSYDDALQYALESDFDKEYIQAV